MHRGLDPSDKAGEIERSGTAGQQRLLAACSLQVAGRHDEALALTGRWHTNKAGYGGGEGVRVSWCLGCCGCNCQTVGFDRKVSRVRCGSGLEKAR